MCIVPIFQPIISCLAIPLNMGSLGRSALIGRNVNESHTSMYAHQNIEWNIEVLRSTMLLFAIPHGQWSKVTKKSINIMPINITTCL